MAHNRCFYKRSKAGCTLPKHAEGQEGHPVGLARDVQRGLDMNDADEPLRGKLGRIGTKVLITAGGLGVASWVVWKGSLGDAYPLHHGADLMVSAMCGLFAVTLVPTVLALALMPKSELD